MNDERTPFTIAGILVGEQFIDLCCPTCGEITARARGWAEQMNGTAVPCPAPNCGAIHTVPEVPIRAA